MKLILALGLACWKLAAMSWKASVNEEAAKITISPETAAVVGADPVGCVSGALHAATPSSAVSPGSKRFKTGIERAVQVIRELTPM